MNWWDPYFQESGHLNIASVVAANQAGDITREQMQGLMSFYSGGGSSLGDTSILNQYQPSASLSDELASQSQDPLLSWAGGGGVGGTKAKELFYPSENTGFAGTGSGISENSLQGGSYQDLMKQLKG